MTRRQVAVVGSGVAGLTAAYILQQSADVTLYEADPRLGGHAHTHELSDSRGAMLQVDSGFIVHNAQTYPHLLRLFGELDVATQDSEMSMSITCDGCGLQYAGARGIGGLFPTAGNLARPRYLYLLTEILRFHRRALAMLAAEDPQAAQETMDAFVRRGRFSHYFRRHFVTPLISAVWSTSPEHALQYPAVYLFRFLENHGMLSVTGSPQWRTVVGGSARYVEKVAKNLRVVHTATPVTSVERDGTGVLIRDAGDGRVRFDAAVIATHADEALRLLATPTATQAQVLGAITYSHNPTVLHTDTSVIPQSPAAQSSWNYRLPDCAAGSGQVHVSYDMNRLQRLDTPDRFLVTLNDEGTVAEDTVLARMDYAHPIFTPDSVAAQARLPEISDDILAFAGAYHGWGFHEDGCRSGVEAAARLGATW